MGWGVTRGRPPDEKQQEEAEKESRDKLVKTIQWKDQQKEKTLGVVGAPGRGVLTARRPATPTCPGHVELTSVTTVAFFDAGKPAGTPSQISIVDDNDKPKESLEKFVRTTSLHSCDIPNQASSVSSKNIWEEFVEEYFSIDVNFKELVVTNWFSALINA